MKPSRLCYALALALLGATVGCSSQTQAGGDTMGVDTASDRAALSDSTPFSDGAAAGDSVRSSDARNGADGSAAEDVGRTPDAQADGSAGDAVAAMDTMAADVVVTPGDSAQATDVATSDACLTGETLCGSACVSVVNNPAHCGACGNVCGGPTPLCAGTTCVSTCPSGATMCGAACVDIQTDPNHCGACNQAIVCHYEICRAGNATCAPGYTECGGAGGSCLGCKNLQEDPENCGACRQRCVAGEVCSAGNCVANCSATDTLCGRSCVADPLTDPAHCGCIGGIGGGLGTVCGPGTICSGGTCATYQSAPGCNTCPCTSCAAPNPSCCSYANETVCTAAVACP